MREKRVFKTDEVPHIWAQQKQNGGRNARGNMYFDGKTIYSYGSHFPMATFINPETVLMTTNTYSNTTAGHLCSVRDAIRHLKVFRVPNIGSRLETVSHNENLKWFLDEMPIIQKQVLKARLHADSYRAELERRISDAVEYTEFFKKSIDKVLKAELRTWKKKLDSKSLFSEKELLKIKAVISDELKLVRAVNAVQRAEKERRVAEAARTAEENLNLWLAGEEMHPSRLYNLPVALRIHNKAIETTRGANVPLIEARKLWHKLQKKESVEGMGLGHYTVTRLDGSTLIVGCHQIPMREVYRMAKALKWDNPTLEVA